MSADQSAPVPPGWVGLRSRGGTLFVAPASAWRYSVSDTGSVTAWIHGEDDCIKAVESPAEVAAQIAAAQRAQRRFDALPAMAAIMGAARGMLCASEVAAEIIDAIEAREAGR